MAKKKKRSMGSGPRRAAQAAKTGITYLKLPQGVKLFKEEEDIRYNLDIVPYVVKDVDKHLDSAFIESDIWWRLPYKLHRNIGPDRKDIVCPGTFGKPCDICKDRDKIYRDPDGDEEVAKLLYPKNRILYIVIPKKNKKYPEEPHIWDISYHNFNKQLDKELDYEEDYKTFAELQGGYTLKVRFVKAKIGKFSFPECDRIDFKEREEYDDSFPDELPVLEDCLVVLSNKEIKKFYKGIDDVHSYDEDDEDDENEDGDSTEGDDEDEDSTEDDEDGIDEEETEYTVDDILQLKKRELLSIIKEEDLDVDPKKIKKVSDLKDAIIKELGLNEEDDDCPHGYTFGDDNGEKDECADCDKYDECLDALE